MAEDVILLNKRRAFKMRVVDGRTASARPWRWAVNACLCPLYSCEGMAVVTVEGLGTRRGGLHPVQAALAHAHGSQCGYCTPGFVMSMYALLRSKAGGLTQNNQHQLGRRLDPNLPHGKRS